MAEQQTVWYRSTLYCAFLVAMTAFTCPGIYAALNGLGAGGGVRPNISNAANSIIFGIITITGPFVGSLTNRISPKWVLFLGTFGYTPYAAGLYCNNRFGTNWLLLFGAVLLGFSGTFLWVAAGAILLAYTEENRKGFAMSLKFAFASVGAFIGDIISLALNVKNGNRGAISNPTYIALMTIMSLGFPFALLLPNPEKVQRTDGEVVKLVRQRNFIDEFRIFKGILKKPALLAMLPLMLYGQWFMGYQSQFNYAYFSIRSRALNSVLFQVIGIFSALAMGRLLDWDRFPRITRAKIGFVVILITAGTSWILAQIVQVHYSKVQPTLDWEHPSYGLGALVYCLWGLADPMVSTYIYWLAGTLTNNLNETSFISGIINSIQCLGSTFGFVITTQDLDYRASCAINLALFFIALPPTAWVVFTKVTNTAHGTYLTISPNSIESEEQTSRHLSINTDDIQYEKKNVVSTSQL